MSSRGESQFVNFPRFAAGLYSGLSQTRSLEQQYQEIAVCFLDQIKNGRLLDVGTGPGRLLLEIHKLNPELQLYGLDVSQAMIELAKKNLADLNADLKLANICATGYDSDSFDAVVCTGSFYLWDEPEKGLNEIYRILKPGHGAHLFETRRDYDHNAYRSALKSNLKQERLTMRWFGPFFLAQALRMAYHTSEVAEIVKRTSFSGKCRIENISLVGLPFWMHIRLTK
jgi:ubiquinone/menaquinone biosynthesis C-methylase UbiE